MSVLPTVCQGEHALVEGGLHTGDIVKDRAERSCACNPSIQEAEASLHCIISFCLKSNKQENPKEFLVKGNRMKKLQWMVGSAKASSLHLPVTPTNLPSLRQPS